MTNRADELAYDPTAEAVLASPWAAYEQLRAGCPVHRHDGLEHPLYSLSRYDDIQAMLTDPELWSNRYGPGISYSDQNSGSLQRYDPPEHSHRRRFVRAPFLPRAVEANRPAISALARRLAADLAPKGRAELHDDFASPLPITAFTELLGLPDADQTQLKHWAEVLTLGMTYPDQAAAEWDSLRAYTKAEVRRRRDAVAAAQLAPDVEPVGQVVPPGLFSHLACHPMDDGSYATDDEVTGLVAMMLVAGHETTASLITNAVWRLLEDRTRWERLVAEPTLIPNAVEESLRYDPPVLGICRTNTEPVELHGIAVPAQAKGMYLMGAANRDPDEFTHPEEFVVDRPLEQSRHHLAFGWGIHFCLGAHLARLTGRVALETLVDRFPDLELDGQTRRLDAPFLWGRRRLPVRWGASG